MSVTTFSGCRFETKETKLNVLMAVFLFISECNMSDTEGFATDEL